MFVNDLAEEPVASVEEALALLAKSEQSRRVGDTKLNEKSSRSHAIFRLVYIYNRCIIILFFNFLDFGK